MYGESGIITREGDNETYIYISGLELPRPIEINEEITLEPVTCNPKPDDMIDCIMKTGSLLEYDLGVLISSLRTTTAQLHIKGKTGKELAVTAWNAQSEIISVSAILDCFAIWFFQSNETATAFNSTTRINIINRSIMCLPHTKRRISEEECNLLEELLPRMHSLESDKRFQTSVNALWSSYLNPRPAVKAMVLWGGIESLFLIEKNIKNALSKKISVFLDDTTMEEQVKELYRLRSKSVHELSNNEERFIEDSRQLLHRLIMRCIETNQMPPLE